MSEPANLSEQTAPKQRMSMPGRLWGVLGVLVFQVLANGILAG